LVVYHDYLPFTPSRYGGIPFQTISLRPRDGDLKEEGMTRKITPMAIYITIICIILLAVGFAGGYVLNAIFTKNKLSDAYSEMYLREQTLLKQINDLEKQVNEYKETLRKVMKESKDGNRRQG
jgi:hypothetical protein